MESLQDFVLRAGGETAGVPVPIIQNFISFLDFMMRQVYTRQILLAPADHMNVTEFIDLFQSAVSHGISDLMIHMLSPFVTVILVLPVFSIPFQLSVQRGIVTVQFYQLNEVLHEVAFSSGSSFDGTNVVNAGFMSSLKLRF